MPVQRVPLSPTPPKPRWLVDRIFPGDKLSTVFAPAGVGKTRLLAYLAAQLARPEGQGHFLGRAVQRGRVVILDADDEGAFGYQMWVNRFLNGYPDANRSLIDLRVVTDGLTPEDVAALALEFDADPPVCIVLDSFLAAFVGLDNLQTHRVQEVYAALSGLAHSLGCAVVTIDHVGKLQRGQTVLEKGAFGSGKSFKPRAVLALSRVPPDEVEGRNVFKLECAKMSYAAEFEPIGFAIELERDDTAARVSLVDLPGKLSLTDRAKGAIYRALAEAQGKPVPRKALIEAAVSAASVTERTAERALRALVLELGDSLTITRAPDNSKAFTFLCNDGMSETPDSSVQDEANVPDIPSPRDVGNPPPGSETPAPTPALDLERAWALLDTLPEAERGPWRMRLNRERENAARELLVLVGGDRA
jgi:hypothetical protein